MWAWRMDWWHDEESLPSPTGPSAPSSSRAVIAWIMSNRLNVFCRSNATLLVAIIILIIKTTSYFRKVIQPTARLTSGTHSTCTTSTTTAGFQTLRNKK